MSIMVVTVDRGLMMARTRDLKMRPTVVVKNMMVALKSLRLLRSVRTTRSTSHTLGNVSTGKLCVAITPIIRTVL